MIRGDGILTKPFVQASDDTKTSQKMGTVSSTVAILQFLAHCGRPMGVNTIARSVSLAPSSCFKILKSLVTHEFVEFSSDTKEYSLGWEAIALARRALDPSRAFDFVRPRLEEIAYEHSIAVGLWRVHPRSRMALVGFAEGGKEMRIHMSLGQRVPMFIGAVGRAIAAALDLPQQMMMQEFKLLRWQTPLTFEVYWNQVERAKLLGYGLDEGNFSRGVTTVAVAITDSEGNARYGLSGIMFSGQYDDAGIQEIGDVMIKLGKWTSTRLIGTVVSS
jgi:DNA-binding IclR family transcriptional regulator